MKHSQALLGKTSKIVRCTCTFTCLGCTGFHEDTSRSHETTWFSGSSLTLTPRRWPWVVWVGRSLRPSGHEIMMRCIRCQSPWLSWLLHSSCPTIELNPEAFWRSGLRSQLVSGLHPTRSTRQRYQGRCANAWSYSHVDWVAKQALKPFLRVQWSHWTN